MVPRHRRSLTVLMTLVASTLLSLACEGKSAPSVAATSTAVAPTRGSGAAAPTPRLSVAIPAIPLASLAEARAGLETPLLVPRTLPPGYQLQRIIHDVSHDRTVPWMNAVRLYYLSPAGDELVIRQGFPLGIEDGAYRFAPSNLKGTLTVQGQPGTWVYGVVMPTGPNRQLVWYAGPLELKWQTGERTGVSLESSVLSLADLLTVANSMQPY